MVGSRYIAKQLAEGLRIEAQIGEETIRSGKPLKSAGKFD
jgi:hypothetical protein